MEATTHFCSIWMCKFTGSIPASTIYIPFYLSLILLPFYSQHFEPRPLMNNAARIAPRMWMHGIKTCVKSLHGAMWIQNKVIWKWQIKQIAWRCTIYVQLRFVQNWYVLCTLYRWRTSKSCFGWLSFHLQFTCNKHNHKQLCHWLFWPNLCILGLTRFSLWVSVLSC